MDLRPPLSLFRKIEDEAKGRFAPLDGLRALAALSVLCSHTGVLPLPFGTLGVILFFNLSTFLLSPPFITSNEIFSLSGTLRFWVRRICRIMPMLIVYVFIYGAFVEGGSSFIIDSLIKFKGYGHLWTINQEMLFYAVMPAFAALVAPVRSRPLLAAAIFVLLAIISDKYLTYEVFKLPGMTGYQQFFLSSFLMGMASAYMVPYMKPLANKIKDDHLSRSLLLAVILGCLISMQWAMVNIYVETGANVVGNWALLVSIGCCALLLWMTSISQNWLSVILSFWPIRVTGIVGYSFYLWHWIPVILLPQEWLPIVRFSIAFFATFALSLVTFLVIERPGIRLGTKLASILARPPAMQLY